MLDKFARQLLRELQRDARQTMQQLAEKVGLSTTPCWRRIKELEEEGAIRRYTVLVDREKVGLQNCVFAEVALSRHAGDVTAEFEAAVAATPEIVACYATTGKADYLIKVVTSDIKAYDAFYLDHLSKLPTVQSIISSVPVTVITQTTILPIAL